MWMCCLTEGLSEEENPYLTDVAGRCSTGHRALGTARHFPLPGCATSQAVGLGMNKLLREQCSQIVCPGECSYRRFAEFYGMKQWTYGLHFPRNEDQRMFHWPRLTFTDFILCCAPLDTLLSGPLCPVHTWEAAREWPNKSKKSDHTELIQFALPCKVSLV